MPEIGEATATEAPAPSVALADAPAAAEAEANAPGGWTRALVVVSGSVPAGAGNRKVVVVESRSGLERDKETGQVTKPADTKMKGYPAGADLYIRKNPDVQFPAGPETLTIGVDIGLSGVGGFAERGLGLRSGPDIAYIGANAAYHRGARDIAFSGASKELQEKLLPWLEAAKMPQGLKFSFI